MLVEQSLDEHLSRLCVSFSMEKYEEVVLAYSMLGRPKAVIDRLNTHFVSAVQSVTKAVVSRFVQADAAKSTSAKPAAAAASAPAAGATGAASAAADRGRPTGTSTDQDSHAQFKQLINRLNKSSYSPCLVELCEALCSLMVTYVAPVSILVNCRFIFFVRPFNRYEQITQWHAMQGAKLPTSTGSGASLLVDRALALPPRVNSGSMPLDDYFKNKLEVGRQRIWQVSDC